MDRLRLTGERGQVLRSGMWGTFQQGLLMVANAGVAVVLVRALPIQEYGLYAYALTLCGFGLTIMTAGLSAVAVKALVDDEPKNAETLASLLLIREAFAVLGYLGIVGVSFTSESKAATVATLVAGVVLFVRALNTPDLWYTSTLQLGRSASIRSACTVGMLGIRILAWVTGGGLWLFLALYVAESLLASVLVLRRYLRDTGAPGFARPKRATVGHLLRRSWPLLVSGVANQVNLRADVVIIQAMVGTTSVAVYSAAARISEVAYFLPAVFMNAVFPVLLRTRQEHGKDSAEYRNMLQRSYDRAFWLGVAIAVVVGLMGGHLVALLFGPTYSAAATILTIQLAACPFVFMATVFSKWIVAEDTLWVSVTRHSIGAAINVVLNLLLLPRYGLNGSAVATVVSYVAASYLSCFLTRTTRPAAFQMTLAIVAPARIAGQRLRLLVGHRKGDL